LITPRFRCSSSASASSSFFDLTTQLYISHQSPLSPSRTRFRSPLVADTTNCWMGLLEDNNIARGIIGFVKISVSFSFLGSRESEPSWIDLLSWFPDTVKHEVDLVRKTDFYRYISVFRQTWKLPVLPQRGAFFRPALQERSKSIQSTRQTPRMRLRKLLESQSGPTTS
jgi:hypothetical protein